MKRKIVSLSILGIFGILSITGILMYIQPYQKHISLLHTIMGGLFMLGAFFHFGNNWKAIVQYMKSQKQQLLGGRWVHMSIAFIAVIIIALSKFDLPPLSSIHHFGEQLRGKEEIYFKKLATNENFKGRGLSVEVLYNQPSHTPTLAIWVEDKMGNYLHDIYVTEKLAKQSFINFEHKRRPEALPIWSHRRGIKATDGLFVPDEKQPIVDGMTGATPKTNFILKTNLKHQQVDSIRIFMEINQSFDWNNFYHQNAFPDDAVYSGPGMVGQPALLYGTGLLSVNHSSLAKMQILGKAHHSGQHGEVLNDLTNITTALEMVERVIIEIKN